MALAGKSKHDVVSEFRCAEILASARKVFATRGFSEATVDEIASEAGIAKGTVYLYYPSKKDIYLAALMQGVVELHERTATKLAAAEGVEAKLRSFVRTRIEYAEEHRDFIKIYHSEFGNLANEATCGTQFQELYLKQAKMLELVLQTAVESGEIRPVRASFAAFIIYAMVKGVMTLRLMGWSTGGVEDDIAMLSELVWKGLCLNEANGEGIGGIDCDNSASGSVARAGSVFG
jgi:AcrR family transcriptional regulator